MLNGRRCRFNICDYLPGLRPRGNGNNAHRRLSVVLRMHFLRHGVEANARRLLRVLLVWQRGLPADTGGSKLLRRALTFARNPLF